MRSTASLSRLSRVLTVFACAVALVAATTFSIAGPRHDLESVAAAIPASTSGATWTRPMSSLGPVRTADWWGGTYRGQDGTAIRVYVSDEYPVDDARVYSWVDFLDGIPHGRELADLTLYVAPAAAVSRMCGEEAYGCYFYDDESIVVIGDDVELPRPLTVLQVLAHEYGHHVANNRSNPPWEAVMRGTKRWASVTDVCACVREGSLGDRYDRDPGEGFAETYRVLVDRQRGVPYVWPIVDGVLAPTAKRSRAARLDVLQPWVPITKRRRARLPLPGRVWTWTMHTPWDGRLAVTVRSAPSTRIRVTVVNPSTGRVATSGINRATTLVCGERTLRLEVRTVSGAGRFTLTVVQS